MTPNEPRDFFGDAIRDPEVRRHFERERAADEFVMQVELLMEEQGVSRTDLAERLKCSPANITRLLRRGTNLTIGRMVDIVLALKHRMRPVVEPATTDRPDWGWVGCHFERTQPILIMNVPAAVEPCSASAVSFRMPRVLTAEAECVPL